MGMITHPFTMHYITFAYRKMIAHISISQYHNSFKRKKKQPTCANYRLLFAVPCVLSPITSQAFPEGDSAISATRHDPHMRRVSCLCANTYIGIKAKT